MWCIGCLFFHSMLDVRRSMFDVRRSSFKTTLYGINATCERLHNNLALMGIHPRVSVSATYHSGTPRLRFWILDLGFLSTVNDIELTVQISRLFFDSHELFSRFPFRNPHSSTRWPARLAWASRHAHPHSLATAIEAPCSPAEAGAPLRSDKLQSRWSGIRNVRKWFHFIVVRSLTPQQATGNALAWAFSCQTSQ